MMLFVFSTAWRVYLLVHTHIHTHIHTHTHTHTHFVSAHFGACICWCRWKQAKVSRVLSL
jgi:hypothetical protein